MRAQSALSKIGILLVMVLTVWPLAGFAQDAGTPEPYVPASGVLIAIHPKGQDDGSRFEVEAKPGEQVTATALITNFGAEPIELRTYVRDLLPSPNGGLTMQELGEEKFASAQWIEYPDEEFTLESQQSIERNLVITVPEGTDPGQYVSAVALETVKPIGDTSGSFEQFFRKVVSIYVTVPGDTVVDFTLGEPEILVRGGLSGVQIPITNSGNTRMDLTGDLTLTAEDGTVVHSGEVRLGPIYMGQETVIQIAFATMPPAGNYTVAYTLTDSVSGVSKSTDPIAVVVPEDTSGQVAPIAFENVVIEANADPIVFANVSVDVTLTQANYPSTRLTLSVYYNGEHVEDFVMADNLSLSQGTTNVAQRYLPATGFVSGEYTFTLKLESVEGGQTSMLFEEKDVATLEVP